MLERFARDARAVVIAARAESIRRGDGWIGTEHLLVGLLDVGGDAADALTVAGVDLADVRSRIAAHVGGAGDLDAEALATLGIDLEAVQQAAEDQFGAGALAPTLRGRRRPRVTRRAKKVLELSLREAKHDHASAITTTHLLLALLREGNGLGVQVLREAGTDLERLGSDLRRRPAA